MTGESWLLGLMLGIMVAGCGAPDAGRASRVDDLSRPGPQPLIEPELYNKVWTTAHASDECLELSGREVWDQSSFETLEGCQAWVRSRRCRPHTSCWDGCNVASCDGTGMSGRTTMKACGVDAGGSVGFELGSLVYANAPDWDDRARRAVRALRPPQRTLLVTGYALVDEAPSDAEWHRLALERAEAVRQELVARGTDAARLVVKVGDPVRGVGRVGHVRVEAVPRWPLPDDFDPSHPQYKSACWVKYPARYALER
jgi:hypothetical protein